MIAIQSKALKTRGVIHQGTFMARSMLHPSTLQNPAEPERTKRGSLKSPKTPTGGSDQQPEFRGLGFGARYEALFDLKPLNCISTLHP